MTGREVEQMITNYSRDVAIIETDYDNLREERNALRERLAQANLKLKEYGHNSGF